MRWVYVFRVVGVLISFFGLSMLVPVFYGFFNQDPSLSPTLIAMGITLAVGLLMVVSFRIKKTGHISQREGMAIVTLGWTAMGFFGSLPFFLGEEIPQFVDAVFESVSGVTTTGSSILTHIGGMSRGLLLWRSFIQWLGGMGIIVLSLAILPFLGVGGMQLYKAEVPSPVPDKLTPRIRETAIILWKVYLFFTMAEIVLLMVAGMGLFDAVCHGLTTLPTGGFSTKNTSVTHFDSIYIDGVITFFMFVAGINFSLHYQMLRGRPLVFWRDEECRFYLLIVFVLVVVVTFDIHGYLYEGLGQAFRYSSFQVISLLTTTGFGTADYEKWPAMSQLILFFLMFVGGSAGSTGGGMKCLRIMLCFKYCYRELFSMVHPKAVTRIKINGSPVPEEVLRSILGFLALYVGLFVLCSVLLGAMGVDFITSFSAVLAALSNIGPGFGLVGPVDNFAHIPDAGKWLLIWCMLLGRLEILTVIIFLVPEFYRK